MALCILEKSHKAIRAKAIDRAGWSSLVARRAHNPEVVGSNPAPATKKFQQVRTMKVLTCFLFSAVYGFPRRSRSVLYAEIKGLWLKKCVSPPEPRGHMELVPADAASVAPAAPRWRDSPWRIQPRAAFPQPRRPALAESALCRNLPRLPTPRFAPHPIVRAASPRHPPLALAKSSYNARLRRKTAPTWRDTTTLRATTAVIRHQRGLSAQSRLILPALAVAARIMGIFRQAGAYFLRKRAK